MNPDATPVTPQELAFRADCCALDTQLHQLLRDADHVRTLQVPLADVLDVLRTDPDASDAERAAFQKARNSILMAFVDGVPR